jgi:hypothetical protein
MSGGGAKPGERRGGRQKGTRNKTTQERLDEIAAGGEMPLDYLLRKMRDDTVDAQRRDDMAKAAAPYCHPRLATIDHGNKDGNALVVKIVD